MELIGQNKTTVIKDYRRQVCHIAYYRDREVVQFCWIFH